MAITLRNSAKGNNSTTSTLTVSLSASVGDIIVVHIGFEVASTLRTVSSVTDAAGNTYAKRFASAGITEPTFSTVDGLEVWWAYCASALTAGTITVNLSGAIDDAVTVAEAWQGFTGTAYQTAPWDTNASLPKTASSNSGTNSTPTVTGVSTTSTAGVLIDCVGTIETGNVPSPPTGWTNVQQGINNGAIRSWSTTVDDLSYSSAQSSITVATTGLQQRSWIYYVDALTIPTGGGGGVSVNITGVASTSAAGTPTVTGLGNVTLAGVVSTSAAGSPTVSGKSSVTINGVAATSAANVPSVTGFSNVTPTGVSSSSAAGTPTVTGFANVTLTGATSASQIGTLTVTVGGATSVNITGVQSASAAGTPSITGFANVSLTGVSSASSAGSLTVTAAANASPLGVQSSSATGTFTETGFANVPITGVLGNGLAGDITVSVPTAVSVTLGGVSSLGWAGIPTTNLDQTPTVGGTRDTWRGSYDRREVDRLYDEWKNAARKVKEKKAKRAVENAVEALEAVQAKGILADIAPAIELRDTLVELPARPLASVIAEIKQQTELLLQVLDEEDEEFLMMVANLV